MSGGSEWMANPPEPAGASIQGRASGYQQASQRKASFSSNHRPGAWKRLKPHNFCDVLAAQREKDWEDRDPDLWLYRRKTTGVLRRYMRWSLEAGRVPSLLGRELFRSKISAYTATTFESRIIFLHDVEVCLERMNGFDREIVARVVLQEHDHEGAARLLGCDRKTIERRLPELLDELTEAFLRAELLERLPESKEEAV